MLHISDLRNILPIKILNSKKEEWKMKNARRINS